MAQAKRKTRATPDRRRTRGAGSVAEYVSDLLVRTRLPYSTIRERTRRAFPGSRTSRGSIRWYASDLRRRGVAVPDRPVSFDD
ncbi:hypothetical protein IB60_17025 [Brucella abortus LMN1]|nr:hypothetical protein IB60_17025 [Brucella abortus LMN1]